MLENQEILNDAIAKQKDADFIERMLLRDKELDEKELTYYMEKERVLQLHRKIYEEKRRLKAKRHYDMCREAFNDIVNASLKEVEYKRMYGEEPTRRIRDSWKKMFVAAVPFYEYVQPVEHIVEDADEIEEIVHLEIDRQDRIDRLDFESYINYEWPWELDNVEIDEKSAYEMECGLNVLGSIVFNVLVVKYPFPAIPPKLDLPNVTISVCINGLTDTSWLPLLQKILDERQVLVVEMQDAMNFCLNAYNNEIKVEVEDEPAKEEPKAKGKGKKGKPEKKAKEKKGAKPKAKDAKKGKGKGKGKAVAEPGPPPIELAEKSVQTPRLFPCEEIPLSEKAKLGKLAQEQLDAGDHLTDHLLVVMLVEYLKSKPDIKGIYVLLKRIKAITILHK